VRPAPGVVHDVPLNPTQTFQDENPALTGTLPNRVTPNKGKNVLTRKARELGVGVERCGSSRPNISSRRYA